MMNTQEKEKRQSVYIVEGKNGKETKRIEELLQNTFGLHCLTKQDVAGSTGGSSFIGDILNVAFEKAQAVIVLLTPEENVRLRQKFWRTNEDVLETEFHPQPTQEQIFEAGYAFGKFPQRTILIRTGEIRPMSDIVGRFILSKEEVTPPAIQLRDNLLQAGCIIKDIPAEFTDQEDTDEKITSRSNKQIFVVFGRNLFIRQEMFAFLRELKLSPMDWNENIIRTKSGAPYIGEIVKAGIDDAKAVIVLLTGDDEVRQKAGSLEITYPQARQNVLFEAGMAFSKYAMKQTILVEIGRVRPCSNFEGRSLIRLNNRPSSRKELIKLLEALEFKVDIHSNWHTTGNFSFSDN